MKLVNAGIKSKKELAQRLIDGEVFFNSNGHKVYFDCGENNPFRVNYSPMDSGWRHYEGFRVEPPWYENITEPAICWVWDSDEGSKLLQLVVSFGDDPDYPFTTKYNKFTNARPVTSDDLIQQ